MLYVLFANINDEIYYQGYTDDAERVVQVFFLFNFPGGCALYSYKHRWHACMFAPSIRQSYYKYVDRRIEEPVCVDGGGPKDFGIY